MPLSDFQKTTLSFEGKPKAVYQLGEGPAVVIMHEIPGITPHVAGFAERVAKAGFRVYMPHLFGTPGDPLTVVNGVTSIVHVCISKEFTAFARKQSSPVTSWLRALCRHAHEECGGRGVGALGMCFTGGFALALMVDETVMAPVLSQPSNPLPITASHRAAIDLSDEDMAVVKERTAAGCSVLGLRFTEDRMVPDERFAFLRQELGDGFMAIEIDSSPGNPHGIKKSAHSVLTADFVDTPGHPTHDAFERVLALFNERLRGDVS